MFLIEFSTEEDVYDRTWLVSRDRALWLCDPCQTHRNPTLRPGPRIRGLRASKFN